MLAAYYTSMLVELCRDNQLKVAPYVVRTRFERGLYGLLVAFSMEVAGSAPHGISSTHIEEFLCGKNLTSEAAARLREGARIFERFTYLCDTSNWSSDGQDPRIELCRTDMLKLCRTIAGPKTPSPIF